MVKRKNGQPRTQHVASTASNLGINSLKRVHLYYTVLVFKIGCWFDVRTQKESQ